MKAASASHEPARPDLRFTNGRPVGPWPSDYDRDPRFAYLEWLRMEMRLLRMEMWPDVDPNKDFTPCNTFAMPFHFPHGGLEWRDAEPPSYRALRVLEAAGVAIPTDVKRLEAAA